MNIFSKILSGSGIVKSVENIASEWITTDMESAEAKVLMVKTLDPNGLMRRQISITVTNLYVLYIFVSLFLLAFEFFGFGDAARTSEVTAKIVALFIPITSLFTVIVSASFGVNYANTKAGK